MLEYYEKVSDTLKYCKLLEKQKKLLLLFYQDLVLTNIYMQKLQEYRYARYKLQYLQELENAKALVEEYNYLYTKCTC